jgi:hypothetical protein
MEHTHVVVVCQARKSMHSRPLKLAVIGMTMALQAGQATPQEVASPGLMIFRKAIGFDAALVKNHQHHDESIHLDWMHLEVPPQLTGWQTGTRELQPSGEDGSRTFYWQFERGDELLTIIAHIHRPGTDAAGRAFLEIANATTTMAIPYIAGPKDLGVVSAIEQGHSNGVFWFDRNVCVEITRSQTKVSHMDIAYWVQAAMNKSIAKIVR